MLLEGVYEGYCYVVRDILYIFDFFSDVLINILFVVEVFGNEILLIEIVDYIFVRYFIDCGSFWLVDVMCRVFCFGLDCFLDKMFIFGCLVEIEV